MKKAQVRNLLGIFLILAGICMIVFSAWFLIRYRANTRDMEDNATELLRELNKAIPNKPIKTDDHVYEDGDDMPAIDIKGISCIGKLKIPKLDLELPVANSSSDIGYTPIHISGTPDSTDFVIEALGYSSQFGKLSKLELKDNIIFVDLFGYQYSYEITGIVSGTEEQLQAMDEAMLENSDSSVASLAEGTEEETIEETDTGIHLPGVETVVGNETEENTEKAEEKRPELILRFQKSAMTYVRVAGLYRAEEDIEDESEAAG